MRQFVRQSVTAVIVAFSPVLANGQGRIVPRPCAPPPCPDVCGTVRPVSTVQCGGQLERISNSVRVVMADRVLRYEVTEVFRNFGGMVAEADYIFPLPSGAAFEDLKLSINGELVSGETMSADKARGIYEEIVRRQRDPALVEWMGAGMLRTRIFPIAPGEEKTVVVRYQSVAHREGDALRIDYRRGTDPVRGVSVLRPQIEPAPRRPGTDGEQSETWSKFTLEYPRSDLFGTAYSPTHSLRNRDTDRSRVVEARGVSGDVTVLVPVRTSNTASMSVLTHAPGGEDGFALITVSPPSDAVGTAPRDLTFVVDVSGSMAGKKLEQAKAAGRALLESLKAGDRFRVVDFSTDVREFRDAAWTTVNDVNLRAARRYIDDLRAEGSTNISEALTVALEAPTSSAGRLPLVVFVTDGEPTVGLRSPDAIANLAAKKRGEARVFTVGVTTGINAQLVEQLALEGRGTAHFVRNDESVESAVSLLARRLSAPVLTDVRIIADGVKLTQVLPAGPIDVFAGQDLVVLARYVGNGNASVKLTGKSPGGPVTWTTTATFRERERANPFVGRLWAAQRIGWLAAEKRRNGGSTELDNEIRTLGERFGIPTEFSSYLVLEPGMDLQSLQNGRPRVERGQVGGQVGSGAGTGIGAGRGTVQGSTANAPPPVATSPANASADARFEAARASAEQRSAKSLSALDVAATGTERTVGNRRFVQSGGVWRDVRLTPQMKQVRVKAFSTLYFELLKQLDELNQPFALGDKVIVAGRAVAIALDPEGIESMTSAELQALLRDWR